MAKLSIPMTTRLLPRSLRILTRSRVKPLSKLTNNLTLILPRALRKRSNRRRHFAKTSHQHTSHLITIEKVPRVHSSTRTPNFRLHNLQVLVLISRILIMNLDRRPINRKVRRNQRRNHRILPHVTIRRRLIVSRLMNRLQHPSIKLRLVNSSNTLLTMTNRRQ